MNWRKIKISRRYFLLIISLTIAFESEGQDIAFSQFYQNPLFTNSALIGVQNHTQVMLHYRNQPIATGESFNTGHLSLIYPFLSQNSHSPRGGIGVSLLGDNAASFLNTFGLNLGLAYNLHLNKAHRISIGFQSGYYQRSLNIGEITTDAQFMTGVFRSEADIGEAFENTSVNFLTASGGVFWYLEDAFLNKKAFFGISYNNFNRPDLAFFSDRRSELPANWTLIGGINAWKNERFALAPNFRWIRRLGFSFTNIGSWFTYYLPDQGGKKLIREGSLSLGTWYNTNRMAVLALKFEQPKYFLTFSYDIPTGANSQTWLGNGAVEVVFGLKFPRKVKTKKPDPDPIQDTVLSANVEPIDTISSNTLEVTNEQFGDSVDVDISIPKNLLGNDPRAEFNEPENKDPIVINDYQRILTAEERRMFNYHIRFGFSSNNYPPKYLKLMDNIAQILQKNPSLKLEIVGHTCDIGTADANRQLSLKRANAIKSMIAQRGIDPARISTKGLGQEAPLVPNSHEDNRRKNRRVEFKVYYE